MPTLALLHTVTTLPAVFQPLVRQALPGWSSFNILDESLLQHTVRDGVLSNRTKQRLTQYVFSAIDAGADAVVVTCSTLGNAVDGIASSTSLPIFRIDQGMADEAVRKARRIGVLATLPTTLEPTGTVIRNAARAAGKDCIAMEKLCDGAFDRLAAGDPASHDAMVIDGFTELASQTDLIVLAQASMAHALKSLGQPKVSYLTSPELGIAHVARELAALSA
ncbi:aspartate/glutamate racemase family protein [Rhizobium leguminosarum]|uniref:aspartate/glutamate racemase family protein n=1 Tax=Rhizobium leguminosarum TaxID=384 RepID=UPI001C918A24|nr:aspartate/glutamate racemase family protein [Rhizobium leguminosarum]MBY2944535.1 aspartate/glutamate racemase family protein [Rhizobium leguminosarum]MBY3031775.1 aspartate/glutamate racemase family protein [Rhizobium leguminosarum]